MTPSDAYKAAAATATGPLTKLDAGERKAGPRVFKGKRRDYGHRQLRINQQSTADE